MIKNPLLQHMTKIDQRIFARLGRGDRRMRFELMSSSLGGDAEDGYLMDMWMERPGCWAYWSPGRTTAILVRGAPLR